jgi:phosphatidate cytidylyltransferase
MRNELLNRILTSIVLLPILIYATVHAGIYLLFLLGIFYLLSIFEIIKNTKNLLFISFASVVLFFSFYSYYYLRDVTQQSLIVLLWILTSTFLSDSGGYIFGKLFKGKKITKISPNKTYSGAAGSFILSFSSLPLLNISQVFFLNELTINFLNLKYFIITIFISFVCQIGDLFVSLLKRRINVKNTSNFLPGHGGVLDRIDGLIFVLIFCLLLKLFGII